MKRQGLKATWKRDGDRGLKAHIRSRGLTAADGAALLREAADHLAADPPQTSPPTGGAGTHHQEDSTMTRSTITAVVEHAQGDDPAEALRRYVGQSLGYGRGGSVVVREISGVEAIDEPTEEDVVEAEPNTTMGYLAAMLAELRGTRELLTERL